MNTPLALIISSIIIAIAMNYATPQYEIIPVPNASNPAAWKLDRENGDLYLCATATTKDGESGCSVKFKQF